LNKTPIQGVGKLYSKFNESELIMKQLFESRLIGISKSCKNIEVTKNLVKTFRESTKNSVEHILNMSKCVYEMKIKKDYGELNDYDMNYFCMSVGFKEDSSTFRKFKLMGERYQQFKKYMDKLPSSYTVLYEITTLDPDKFEELMKDGSIYNYITLKDVKKLGNKITKSICDDISFTVSFDKKINPLTKKSLFSIIGELSTLEEVTIEIPKKYQSFLQLKKVSTVPRLCSHV
jgi:hypothetical protein